MRKKLALLCVCVGFLWSYDSIDEALKNGVTKGDLIFYTDWQKLGSGRAMIFPLSQLATYGYLGNTGYILGNIRLGYTSGFYKNIRASISFAAAQPFYNLHKNLHLPTGNLDSNKDFFSTSQASIGESFLEYFDGDTSIKGGRIAIKNEWINTLTDGIWIRNKTINKLLLEAFWARTYGRIDYHQMTNFYAVNPKNGFGIANLGVKYEPLEDLLTIKAYSYFAPNIFTAFGLRATSSFATEKFSLGGEIGGTYSIEHGKNAPNAYEIDGHVYGGYKEIVQLTLGYIHTAKKAGWGSLESLGDRVAPFFVWGGKAVRTQKDANVFYGAIKVKVQRFNFSLIYGTTSFVHNAGHFRQNELDFTTEIRITNNIFMLINLLNTHLGSGAIPTVTEVNGGVRFRF
ncbi:Opr family porin [Helicobacter mustelae]|uniref:Outer membrane protein n=1 Tax=Helicobacter mustelae (strain ATCC 43772 / CCUG 25715 / CIP 103759 / LMG 18044 / NCTC 12198 / R85-136P) TaxID=679897 RepID=D3UFZ8_HELM1|nr:Opr family porin [Helicobacter mustelae]CBG39419.1 Putative hypothetical protein [Helicobacter mustelae 12198]SQH70932.1 Uncharacterised protein [Helicobacter mustelae]STP12058.1 Uncharacterised protein [Helicobacter mustelae]